MLPQSVKIGIWQTHWLYLVSINLYAKNYQSIPKILRVMGILAVTCWPWQCLGQGKVALSNFFFWILSILMCIQSFIKMSHMVEDLQQFPYFYMFLTLPWSKKSGIWQGYWLDFVGIYRYAKNYKVFPKWLYFAN